VKRSGINSGVTTSSAAPGLREVPHLSLPANSIEPHPGLTAGTRVNQENYAITLEPLAPRDVESVLPVKAPKPPSREQNLPRLAASA